MKYLTIRKSTRLPLLIAAALACAASLALANDWQDMAKRWQQDKPTFAKRQQDLLAQHYDLSDRPAVGVAMSGGKPVQEGVRALLPAGVTWDKLARFSPDEIKAKDMWPAAFYPLPHPHHEAGGMVFPQALIDETRRQTARDLTRVDLDFDLPAHLLPDFPPPIYLSTRPDLGDVSKGPSTTTTACSRTW